MLQCQIKPPVNNLVKIKCLKDLTLNGETECKVN